jgi:hypothetical protein
MNIAISSLFQYSIIMKIQQLIKYHLESQKIGYLENSLRLGFEQLPRTQHYKQLLKKGFLLIVEYYKKQNNLFAALKYIEKARVLTPFD